MSMKRLARTCLAGAVLCLAVSPAAAHPPDLPVDTKDVCVPCPEADNGELNTRKPCEPLDATSPFLGEVIGHFLQSFTMGLGGVPVLDLDLAFFGSTLGSPTGEDFNNQCMPLAGGAIVSGSVAAFSAPARIDEGQRAHARKMYLIGERCRRSGDFDMAENCYQETKLLCPGCDYARKADRRIRAVRALRAVESEDIGEESEPPKEEKEPAKKESSKCPVPGLDGNCNYDVGPPTLAPGCSDFTVGTGYWSNSHEKPQEPAKKASSKDPNYDYDIDPPTVIVPTPFSQDPSKMPFLGPFEYTEEPRSEQTNTTEKMSGKKLLFETDMARLSEAKAMYYVGERCRRGGDLDMAYRCYENAYRICPQCRHGKKSLQRMRRVKELKQLELQEGSVISDLPFLAAFPPIQSELIRAFEKLAAEESSPQLNGIEIVLEESRPMIEGDEEESDCPLILCGGTGPQAAAPPTLYVAPPIRDLRLTDELSEQELVLTSIPCEDLSDWLPQAVRLLRGAGSLRIDTSRLGRLMSRGEGAIRELGCDLVHEGGRSFVVYPARR